LPDGEHVWAVKASPDARDITYLDKLRVITPERVFDQQTISSSEGIKFGNDIILSGYDWIPIQPSSGVELEIRLIWHALATPQEDVSVFVHLENSAGELITQHDGVPVNWSRPAPGWLPGEYVVDFHYLTIPADVQPGVYRLYTGLAERTSGKRLHVTAEHTVDNRVLLGQFNITR
jgi:hypothetical protein